MAENQTIILKYSATAGNVPTLDNLVRGELAINSADGKLFIRKAGTTEADDTIISINVKDPSLATLGGVVLDSVSAGQALVYDGTSSEWKNVTLASTHISDFENAVKTIIASELGGATDFVTVTGDQDVGGVKTFTSIPKVSAAQTMEGGDTEVAKLGLLKEQTIYTDTSETGATVTVGGVAKGKKYANTDIIQVIDDILHPYVAPTGVSLTMAATGGTFEAGTTVQVTTGTVKWTNGSQLISKAEVLQGSTVVGSADLSASATTSTITLTNPISVTANTSFTARVTDATKTTSGGNVGYTFVYPFYWGVVDADVTAPTAEQVQALTKVVQGKGNKTFTYTTNGQRKVVAYPKAYGTLKKAIDPNGFDNIDAMVRTEVSITGLDGTAQAYYVYTSSGVSSITEAYTYSF
jgi:hypothetical protein|nr:MAG TPA: hypothetical protein [Caudoviricetes sp.]